MGDSIARSALNPERQSLAVPLILALLLHLGVVMLIICMGYLPGRRPPPFEQNAMEVSMMVLPKSQRAMPDKASRAPTPSRDVPAPKEAPSAGTAKPSEPPPVRESDLVLNKPDAKPVEGAKTADPDAAKAREDLMKQMLMEQMLEQVEDAPVGTVDRTATDPDSESDEAIMASGAGQRGDPELARYVASLQKLFNQNFKPLPTIVAANPGIKATIRVSIDPDTGDVLSYDFVKSSDNDSYDRAAETAVQAVSKTPVPPEKYKEEARQGLVITFEPT